MKLLEGKNAIIKRKNKANCLAVLDRIFTGVVNRNIS